MVDITKEEFCYENYLGVENNKKNILKRQKKVGKFIKVCVQALAIFVLVDALLIYNFFKILETV